MPNPPYNPDQPDSDSGTGSQPGRGDASQGGMDETIADIPSPRTRPRPAAAAPTPPRSTPPPRGELQLRDNDPALDDTVADLNADADYRDPADEPAEIELASVFDRPTSGIETASLSRFDPEAGRTSVAIKVRAVTVAVKNTVATPFGKLLLTFPVVLIGVSLSIAAITIQDTPYIVAAVLVMPIGLVLAYWRYQAWLGHKRYMYRLLETLGEDVSDFDAAKVYRRTGRKMVSRARR